MLLKEILLEANLLVPNSISDEIKVGWLNQVQNQLYRDYAFPNTTSAFTTEPRVNLYLLPTDCSMERITSVIVDDVFYDYRTLDQDVATTCWTIVDGKLLLYPTPTSAVPVFLNYRPSPNELRVDMQEEKPDFPEDFHEILVYGIAVRIARAEQNAELAQVLKFTFDELRDNAKRELQPKRRNKVRVNRLWR